MRAHTATGRFFVCLAALLLVTLPVTPAFAADTISMATIARNVGGVEPSTDTVEGTDVVTDAGEVENTDDLAADDREIDPVIEGDRITDGDLLESEPTGLISPRLLAPPEEDTEAPTVAEYEQSGPKTLDSSKEAISQAATHIATPEQALTAKDATVAVGDPAASANLKQTGNSATEGLVVGLGGVVIVTFCLLLYHFRKA